MLHLKIKYNPLSKKRCFTNIAKYPSSGEPPSIFGRSCWNIFSIFSMLFTSPKVLKILKIWMFLKIGVPQWMICNGKPYQHGWFGGTTIEGNNHMLIHGTPPNYSRKKISHLRRSSNQSSKIFNPAGEFLTSIRGWIPWKGCCWWFSYENNLKNNQGWETHFFKRYLMANSCIVIVNIIHMYTQYIYIHIVL